MNKTKRHWIIVPLFLIPIFAGCGQKGPLYLDNTSDNTQTRVPPEETEQQKDLEDLERKNQTQPDLTY